MSEECALGCGNPVNRHDLQTWHEVTGWVGGPKKDHSRLRTYTGRVAHNHCVGKLQEGQAVDQPDIFAKTPRVKKADRPKVDPEAISLFDHPANQVQCEERESGGVQCSFRGKKGEKYEHYVDGH